jgi:S-ribosylhomocysteine lyase LuxS involved in autoinducer biosynthesis
MKKKKMVKKLSIGKKTIAQLNKEKMIMILGGEEENQIPEATEENCRRRHVPVFG